MGMKKKKCKQKSKMKLQEIDNYLNDSGSPATFLVFEDVQEQQMNSSRRGAEGHTNKETKKHNWLDLEITDAP